MLGFILIECSPLNRIHPVGADAHIGPHTAPPNFRTTLYAFALVRRPAHRTIDYGVAAITAHAL